MGVRHATSVAHLSRSDGQAEVAGCEVLQRFCELHLENLKKNRFRVMRRASQAYRDLLTPSGLSLHQIAITMDRFSRSFLW